MAVVTDPIPGVRFAMSKLLSCVALLATLAIARVGHALLVSITVLVMLLRSDALAAGVRAPTLDAALANVQPIPRILELDRKQPEFTVTFDQYLSRTVGEGRIAEGRAKLRERRALLQEIAAKYQVQPRFIVALWGIETDFGRIVGTYPVVGALATLAYDGRRSAYFRKELLQALRIVDQGHIAPASMTGSWAGAMGQNQFMPSSFLDYAVDFDNDGRRDIWSSEADVFASIANYLSKSGWNPGQSWGRPVRVPAVFNQSLIGLDQQRRSEEEWGRLGVVLGDGSPLPASSTMASLVQPAGPGGAVYLVYDNYRTILRWNRSLYFATAVGTLADRLSGS